MKVKLCFVLDCTASMAPWIKAAKDQIVDIIESTQKRYADTHVYVGFVGYRDVDDSVPIVHLPFTTDIASVKRVLENTRAEEGDDEAEDVAHGLEYALEHMKWQNADVKLLIHITDAPNHGARYHLGQVSDRFPEGIPNRSSLETLAECFAGKKIDYVFFRTTYKTDIMTDIMYDAYRYAYEDIHFEDPDNHFRIVDLTDQRRVDLFVPVSMALQTSIGDKDDCFLEDAFCREPERLFLA